MIRPFGWIGVLTLFGMFGCAAGYADVVVPPGLAPGSTYQLVFVTLDGFFATSTAISDYNLDVTSEAALNPQLAAFDAANGVTWTVIGSTQTVNATANAPSSGAVYTLDGTQAASAAVPLYGGSLLAPIDINQNGATESTYVWTGSNGIGTASGGINDLGQTFTGYGDSGLTSGGWIAYSNGIESDNFIPLYALSSEITVPGAAATPEPATTALLPGAILLLAGVNRLRRRRANSGSGRLLIGQMPAASATVCGLPFRGDGPTYSPQRDQSKSKRKPLRPLSSTVPGAAIAVSGPEPFVSDVQPEGGRAVSDVVEL